MVVLGCWLTMKAAHDLHTGIAVAISPVQEKGHFERLVIKAVANGILVPMSSALRHTKSVKTNTNGGS